jgi:hypothetical protein
MWKTGRKNSVRFNLGLTVRPSNLKGLPVMVSPDSFADKNYFVEDE